MLRRNNSLTSLNLSNNSLGHVGGELITDALERILFIASNDFVKREIEKIEEARYMSKRFVYSSFVNKSEICNYVCSPVAKSLQRNAKICSNLIDLDMSYNNIGPKCFHSLILFASSPNCTLTSLNVSHNPLGQSKKTRSSPFAIGDEFY